MIVDRGKKYVQLQGNLCLICLTGSKRLVCILQAALLIGTHIGSEGIAAEYPLQRGKK